jgi:hypothetical protein
LQHSCFNNSESNFLNNNNSRNNLNKFEESKINKSKKINQNFGPFLNLDYDAIYKVPEIKDEKVKKMLMDVNGFGPYYSHCFSCNKKNLNFYDKINQDTALKMLTTIKETKKKSYFK